GADLALVPRRRVPVLLQLELALLHANVSRHSFGRVPPSELEHRLAQRVEARQRDELALVAELGEPLLEARDLTVVEMSPPVEGGRAVVGHQLRGEALVDRLRELGRLTHVRR